MSNVDVIDKIHNFRETVLEKIEGQDVVSFKVNDIEFDDNLVINDTPISEKALKKIFTSLRVYNDFFTTYKKALDIDSWEDIKYNLKRVNKDTEFFGKKILKPDGKFIISDLYKKNESLTNFNVYDTFDNYFRMVEYALTQTEIPYSIKELTYLQEEENVLVRLLNDDGRIDVFNNDFDIWKKGIDLNWNSFGFSNLPFYERLICSNGMSTRKYGFNTNIQKKSFNPEKIENSIYKMIINPNDKYDEMIKNNCEHLKNNNISVKELLEYKDFFLQRNENEKYQHILNSNIFDENDIHKAYGDIKERSSKWLSTADSGRNSYDFFNNITALSSHTKHFNIDKQDAIELQTIVSDLFFKEVLDLEDTAPTLKINTENPFPYSYIFN